MCFERRSESVVMDSKVNGCRIGGEHSEQEIVSRESWES